MSRKSLINYLANGFVLLIPVFLWNIFLTSRLPKAYQVQNFWSNIPRLVVITETVFRMMVFTLPLFLKLGYKEAQQKLGWFLYLAGLGIYFASWLMQMYFPGSSWSQSAIGFTAPAFTSAFWLIGIGLIGQSLFFKVPYHYSVYIGLTMGFVLSHSLHAYLVYVRI